MSIDLSQTSSIVGFVGACLVDSESGLMFASEGGGAMDMEAAAAVDTKLVRAKLQAMEMMGITDGIEDILITLGKQFHVIRPLQEMPTTFLYLILDKQVANLGMARLQLKKIEGGMSLAA